MKILYFTRGYTVHDDRFLRAFVANKMEAGYLTLTAISDTDEQLFRFAGFKYLGDLGIRRASSATQLDAAVPDFLRVVTSFAPDLVLAGPLNDCAYIAASASLRCPLVAQSWAFDVFWENANPTFAKRTKVALHNSAALFADCHAVAQRCEQIVGRALPASFVMPWGIDLGEISRCRDRGLVRRYRKLPDRKVFLYTRGLEPIYQVETLLLAFSQFHRTCREGLLLLASGGSMRPLVEAFIARHSLQESILLLGPIPHAELLDLFNVVDFYVSCAASDGTSISMLEAMALDALPILSDIGGNREWVQPGQNGWLVPHRQTDRLIEALADASRVDPETRLEFSARNRQIIKSRADFAQNMVSFLSFLDLCSRAGK